MAATCDPPRVALDADIAIWPEFGSVCPNSMGGARFCLDQGIKATEEALPAIRALLEQASSAG